MFFFSNCVCTIWKLAGFINWKKSAFALYNSHTAPTCTLPYTTMTAKGHDAICEYNIWVGRQNGYCWKTTAHSACSWCVSHDLVWCNLQFVTQWIPNVRAIYATATAGVLAVPILHSVLHATIVSVTMIIHQHRVSDMLVRDNDSVISSDVVISRCYLEISTSYLEIVRPSASLRDLEMRPCYLEIISNTN